MYNIILDGVIDTSPAEITAKAAVKIGDNNRNWGGVTPLGDTYGFHISNIHSRAQTPVLVAGSLQDSTITNVMNFNGSTPPVVFAAGDDYAKNVTILNAINATRGEAQK